MEIKLALGGRRRSPGTVVVAVLLLLLLTGASPPTTAAASLDDGNSVAAASRSRWLWRQGNRGPTAPRRLLMAVQPASTAMVGKDTNEFHVEGVHRPANGKQAGEVGLNAKGIPRSGSNRNHN